MLKIIYSLLAAILYSCSAQQPWNVQQPWFLDLQRGQDPFGPQVQQQPQQQQQQIGRQDTFGLQAPQQQTGISQIQQQCPPLAQCLNDDLSTIDSLCSSFSAVLASMWQCVDFIPVPSPQSKPQNFRSQFPDVSGTDRLDELLSWRDDQAGQPCSKFAVEYPEVKDILRCHNAFYTSMNDVYRQSCLVEVKFFECMGWPLASQIDCNNNNVRNSPDLFTARSPMIYDLQLPQKKSLTVAQSVCMRGRLAKQRQCYQTNIVKCPNASARQQFVQPPIIESRLEVCLRQKAQRESEAAARAETQLEQIHQTQKVCLDDAETKLYKRLYQKMLFSVFDSDLVKNTTDSIDPLSHAKLHDPSEPLPTFNMVRFLRSIAGMATRHRER